MSEINANCDKFSKVIKKLWKIIKNLIKRTFLFSSLQSFSLIIDYHIFYPFILFAFYWWFIKVCVCVMYNFITSIVIAFFLYFFTITSICQIIAIKISPSFRHLIIQSFFTQYRGLSALLLNSFHRSQINLTQINLYYTM